MILLLLMCLSFSGRYADAAVVKDQEKWPTDDFQTIPYPTKSELTFKPWTGEYPLNFTKPWIKTTATKPWIKTTTTKPWTFPWTKSSTMTKPPISSSTKSSTMTKPPLSSSTKSSTMTKPPTSSSTKSSTMTKPPTSSSTKSSTTTKPSTFPWPNSTTTTKPFTTPHTNSNDCNMTLEGYTWHFDPEKDKAIPGVSAHECAEKCLVNSWCAGYTWTMDDASGSMCHLFHELINQHPCHDCSHCISGKFNSFDGVCDTNDANDIIAIEDTETEYECLLLCHATQDCEYYSWGCENIFYKKCFLFKECNVKDSCECWQSGQVNCFERDQCKDYKILNDKNRNIENDHEPQLCDSIGSSNTSPDWQGYDWYRILPPAGNMIPLQSPGHGRCGTSASGWMNGDLDFGSFGQTITSTVCYAKEGTKCAWKNQINVTLCGDKEDHYYVYQLPNAIWCNYKYCATYE